MATPPPRDIARMLGRTDLLSGLDESERDALVRRCLARTFRPGELIVSQHSTADRFFAILDGQVKVYQLASNGDEQVLHFYGPGRTFGEAAVWAEGTYPAFAEAISEATLLAIRRDVLRDMIASDPEIALRMMAGMSAKLREFAGLIEDLSLKEVPARLAGALLVMSEQADSSRFRLPQTKRQLAAQIGTAAETLSRALGKLAESGLIGVKGSEITIRDRQRLAEAARS
jgi:CRP/FNR family transcriptional regulator